MDGCDSRRPNGHAPPRRWDIWLAGHTCGRPTRSPVWAAYPYAFKACEQRACELGGFKLVASGPLVRSSYHAEHAGDWLRQHGGAANQAAWFAWCLTGHGARASPQPTPTRRGAAMAAKKARKSVRIVARKRFRAAPFGDVVAGATTNEPDAT